MTVSANRIYPKYLNTSFISYSSKILNLVVYVVYVMYDYLQMFIWTYINNVCYSYM